TRLYRAMDGCGNSAICAQTITVRDTLGPTIPCPANTSSSCGNLNPTTTGTATAIDYCSGVPITHTDSFTPGSCPNVGTLARTWKATDSCNNSSTCVQTISIADTNAP